MDFATLIRTRRTALLDGAMGTELDRRGVAGRACANLTSPDAVLQVHREYARCGCDALITNTLTMNRVYVETHHVAVDVREVKQAGARLVAGCCGTTPDHIGAVACLLEGR